MSRIISTRLLLAVALVIAFPAVATAQQEVDLPEGVEWHLVAYDAGGPELTDVPWDVVATLTLDAGQAYGSAGCNGFGADYQLDGKTLSVGEPMRTFVGCPDARMAVEESYIAALPKVTRWAIDTGVTGDRDLILFDADDEHLLRFSSSGMGLLVGQIRALTEQVDAQQQVIRNLRARIKELEAGG